MRTRASRWFWATAPFFLGLPGCLFGGATEDPGRFVIFAVDSGAPSGGAAGSGAESGGGGPGDTPESGGAGGTDEPVPAAGGLDGAGGSDSTAGGAPGGGGSDSTGGSAPGSAGGALPSGCARPPAPVICDPVLNVGCFMPMSYCDIDSAQGVPTGRCVFPTPPPAPVPGGPTTPDGAAPECAITPLASSCAPLNTCIDGVCRKLCHCDDDCPTALCCSESAPGPRNAFKVCGACP